MEAERPVTGARGTPVRRASWACASERGGCCDGGARRDPRQRTGAARRCSQRGGSRRERPRDGGLARGHVGRVLSHTARACGRRHPRRGAPGAGERSGKVVCGGLARPGWRRGARRPGRAPPGPERASEGRAGDPSESVLHLAQLEVHPVARLWPGQAVRRPRLRRRRALPQGRGRKRTPGSVQPERAGPSSPAGGAAGATGPRAQSVWRPGTVVTCPRLDEGRRGSPAAPAARRAAPHPIPGDAVARQVKVAGRAASHARVQAGERSRGRARGNRRGPVAPARDHRARAEGQAPPQGLETGLSSQRRRVGVGSAPGLGPPPVLVSAIQPGSRARAGA